MSHNHSAWSFGVLGVRKNFSQEEVNLVVEKSKHCFFFVIGCGVIATEVVLRKSTDVVSDLGNAMADAHTTYVRKIRASETLVKGLQAVEPETVGYTAR
jgi:hypothetical protein